ncbi:hypothetical protein BpHYR1_003800 [Brachionus plicatilis]|uniref:Uncharacterized protein n=1 Tax=Brachionus plicatilis TaxID=10195 RepID=A0A3M7RPF8_BRAPC|nr:hypothetical protein BpHYR1_003800 [Brachionus plicatilis]
MVPRELANRRGIVDSNIRNIQLKINCMSVMKSICGIVLFNGNQMRDLAHLHCSRSNSNQEIDRANRFRSQVRLRERRFR